MLNLKGIKKPARTESDEKKEVAKQTAPKVPNPQPQKKFFGEILKSKGKLTDEQIETILREKKVHPERKFGEIAVFLDFVTEKDVAEALAEQAGLEYLDLRGVEPDMKLVQMYSPRVADSTKSLPLFMEDDAVVVAIVDPMNLDIRDKISQQLLGVARRIKYVVVEPMLLTFLIRKVYPELSYESKIDELAERALDILRKEARHTNIAFTDELVASIIFRGMSTGAADIHFVKDSEVMRIFYRRQGILHHFRSFRSELYNVLGNYIKQKAGIQAGDKIHIMDGSLSIILEGKKVSLRVSKLPIVGSSSEVGKEGESLVVRILDKSRLALKLESLGFLPRDLERLNSIVTAPYGFILVTGPTGSGKTTTLYSMLLKNNPFKKNILTVEDPVEYQIAGLRQVQVNPEAEITFARALRAFLRQDPDIILIGEIRDEETAEVAVHAALTGHLVFSTVHANEAVETLVRLRELGVNPGSISSALLATLSQRLLKVLCPNCREETELTREQLEFFHKYGVPVEKVYRHVEGNVNCPFCNGTGYSGMTIAYEIFVPNDELREMIEEDQPHTRIKEKAVEMNAMEPIEKNALKKVAMGITTFDEAYQRVLKVHY